MQHDWDESVSTVWVPAVLDRISGFDSALVSSLETSRHDRSPVSYFMIFRVSIRLVPLKPENHRVPPIKSTVDGLFHQNSWGSGCRRLRV